MTITISAKKRENKTRGDLKRLRNQGRIPAILYGKETGNIYFHLDENEFRKHLSEMKGLIKLRLDGKEYQAMVREIQRDPIKDRFMHIDFMAVQMNQPVDAEVPLHLHGEPVGVKAGGVLQQPLRTVHVRCLPSDIPQDLSLDITNLEVGDSLTLAAVQLPKGVELLSDLETVVASIVPPQAGGDEEPAVEEGAETDEES